LFSWPQKKVYLRERRKARGVQEVILLVSKFTLIWVADWENEQKGKTTKRLIKATVQYRIDRRPGCGTLALGERKH